MIFFPGDDSMDSDSMPDRPGPSSEPYKFRIQVESDSSGLLFATSKDLPGLLVTENTIERLAAEIPKVIETIFGYPRPKLVDPAANSDDAAEKWIAIPDNL